MNANTLGAGKHRKLFGLAVLLTFLSALVYEFLTPFQSDDLSYLPIVREAGSFWGIFSQEVTHYLTHSGRNVSHLIMRFFMYLFDTDRRVFSVVAAVVFTLLTFLMFRLVRAGEDSGDATPALPRYLLVVLLIWLCAPVPGETIFWLTGACNYLFTTTLILGAFLLARKFVGTEAVPPADKREAVLKGTAVFVCALLAGWCNENTSGGVVLFFLILLVLPGLPVKRFPLRVLPLLGSLTGYIIQLSSPGNYSRAEIPTDEHEGILKYAARLLKIFTELETLFLPLILAAVFLFLLCLKQGRKLSDPQLMNAYLFFFLSAATSFCLILVPEPQARVYFGSGIFLMIGCVQLFQAVRWRGELLAALRDFLVAGLLVLFVFTYLREGANLARLYREVYARYAMIEEAVRSGETDKDGDIVVELPQLPHQFDSRYSIACRVDITEDPWQFENLQVSQFFGDNVYVEGIPFDEYMEEHR